MGTLAPAGLAGENGAAPWRREEATLTTLDRLPVVTVGGLVLDDDGRWLVVRTAKWGDRWGIPGGKVERGEPLEAALVRELREETGLAVSDVRFALVQEAIDSPEFHRPAHFVLLNYTCRVAGREPRVQLNEEAQESRWVTLAEAAQLDLNTPTRVLFDHVAQEVRHAR